jgi:hypothetical protein
LQRGVRTPGREDPQARLGRGRLAVALRVQGALVLVDEPLAQAVSDVRARRWIGKVLEHAGPEGDQAIEDAEDGRPRARLEGDVDALRRHVHDALARDLGAELETGVRQSLEPLVIGMMDLAPITHASTSWRGRPLRNLHRHPP